MNLFKRKNYIPLTPRTEAVQSPRRDADAVMEEPVIPDGMWVKCRHCQKLIYKKEMDQYQICPKCGGHFRIGALDRIAITCDEGSFVEYDASMESKNPMNYPSYEKVLDKAREKSGTKEGIICGRCKIDGYDAVIAVMDSNFMMGSMGSVVGEKITRAIEHATEMKLHIVIFTTSGGARMQ